jgi:hypothetical protein
MSNHVSDFLFWVAVISFSVGITQHLIRAVT